MPNSEPSDEETAKLQPEQGHSTSSFRPSLASYVALGSVPLLWGTFTPSMKVLLDSKNAPPVILTNLMSHLVGSAALGVLWALEGLVRKSCLPAETDTRQAQWHAFTASCELGIYLFFGQLTQLLGLLGTTATTNAILVQTSVVFVPLFERSQHKSLVDRLRYLTPSMLALGGAVMVTLGPRLLHGEEGAEASSAQTSMGLGCSLASALFYAMHTVRLSAYGDVDATIQATGQVTMNTVLDLVLLPITALFGLGGNSQRWLMRASQPALRRLGAAAMWNGIMIVAGTTWAMSFAQRTFPASTAALVYAMEPLCAALLAALLLGDRLELVQILGGGLVFAANVVAGTRSS